MINFRKLAAVGAASAAVALYASASHAAITEYFNEADFLAAAGNVELEDFSSATLNPDLTISSAEGSVGGGVWNDRVERSGNSATYSFSHSITAFGANWDETPGGFGQGLILLVDGVTQTPTQLDGFAGGFYGFIDSTPFTSVVVAAGNSGGIAETHTVDDLRYSGGVPEASTWALMLVGFAGLGAAVRARRSAVAA